MTAPAGMGRTSAPDGKRPPAPSLSRWSSWGFIFILPWLAGFLIFTVRPMFISFFLSLTRYDLVAMKFFGLGNYSYLLTKDPLFYKSLWNTALYVAVSVPMGLTGSLLLAMLLDTKVRGMSFFRTIFYIPSLTPAVASSLLWMWVFHPDIDVLNMALRAIGVSHPPGWLQSETWAMPALILMSLWGIGGARMIIFLAGLQGIGEHYYEAATIDGAGPFQRFLHITLPLITPVIYFNLILGVIGGFQVFTNAYIMTEGGPNNATLFYALHLYRNAFVYFKMGRASAMAWILFAILFVFTYVQFRQSRRWVYYEGEEA